MLSNRFLLINIGELKNNFSGGFKLELVTTFHIRFWYDSCENIAKNIVNIIFLIEKYNYWEWILEIGKDFLG